MDGELLENLIYEYYSIQGYLCLKNIPGEPKKKGGRDEIDLIAVKINKNIISEITWIEVTSYLAGGYKTIENKFSDEKERYIRQYLEKIYNIEYNGDIKKLFFIWNSTIKKDTAPNVEIFTKYDLISNLEKLVNDYKEKYKYVAGSKTEIDYITLSKSFKMLELIKDLSKSIE